MATSQSARNGTATDAGTTPRVSVSMVRPARVSAGLSPGTSLSAPNHRNTTPRAMRRRVTPCAAIHSVIRRSIRSNLVIVVATTVVTSMLRQPSF